MNIYYTVISVMLFISFSLLTFERSFVIYNQNKYKVYQRNSIVTSQMIKKEKVDEAIRELEIRTDNSSADRQQLGKIIFEILRFPLISQAKIHKKANRLGGKDLLRNKKELQDQIRSNGAKYIDQLSVCPCCGLLEQDQKIKCCQSLQNVDLGVGVRLYFMSISHHAVIMTLALFIYALFAFITNIVASVNNQTLINALCVFDGTCGLITISLGAKLDSDIYSIADFQTLLMIQTIIGIVFIAIWGSVNFVRRHKQNQLQVQMEIQRVSASNFTLMIENFPKVYLDKSQAQVFKEINRIFAQYQKKTKSIHTYEVVKVNVARPMYNERSKSKQNREQLIQELYKKQELFRKWIQYRRSHRDFPVPIDVRQKAYQDYYKFYTQKYDKKQVYDCALQNKNLIFVTMRSSAARNQILKFHEFAYDYFCRPQYLTQFTINEVSIKRAPQPQQIMWENVGFGTCSKILRVILVYFISLVLLGISFGISIGITYLGLQNGTNLAFLVSIIITIVNLILEYTIFLISFLENEKNKSAQQASIALKISIFQLLNSIGIPLALVYIGNQQRTKNDPYTAVYSEDGLISSVFFIGLFSLITPIGRFIDPFNIFLRIKRWYYSSISQRLKMNGQADLNKHYACYEMDLGYQYAYIIKTIVFTAFFMPMQPIIALFAPIGLGLIFAVNKYKLYYRFDRPRFHSFEVNNLLDWFIGLGPVALALGQIYAMIWIPSQINTGTQVTCWIALGLAVLLYIFPIKFLYCCTEEPQLPNWDYNQKQAVIPSDFDRLNPYTRDQAISHLQHYFKKIQLLQRIPDYSGILKLSVISQSRVNQRDGKQMKGSFYGNAPNYVRDLETYSNLLKRE